MCSFRAKLSQVLFSLMVLVCLLFAGILYAGQPTKVAGKMTMEITEADSVAVADTEGHHMYMQVYEGTNASTGENEFMADAALLNISSADLVQGIGVHQGYCQFTNDDGTTFAKWKGKVTTTISADSTMVTIFEGEFSFINGTGKFSGIQGDGTYTGSFTSKTTLTADWEGEYTIGK